MFIGNYKRIYMKLNTQSMPMTICLSLSRRIRAISAVSVTLLLAVAAPVHAAGLIRDAETEHYLRDLSRPVYQAAGMSPQQVRMFVVNDDALNAFVAGGSNMFLHTGLIQAANTPEMLLGVIAHETGHIAGGHLVRSGDMLEKAQIGSVLTYLLGAASMAAGSPQVGAAILSGGSHAARRNMLSYSRSNERMADQASLTYFDRMGVSPKGILRMFERLRQEEKRRLTRDATSYTRTHPLSEERITHIRNHLRSQDSADGRLSDALHRRHQRVRAKLAGFLRPKADVLNRYPHGTSQMSDFSHPGHIARAVAYSREAQAQKALAELRQPLTDYPDDPYLHELHGHILFHDRQMDKARDAYARAVELAPDAALIRSDYAKVLVAIGTESALATARKELELASRMDRSYHQTWRLLARVYGRQGEMGRAELALAELAALNNDKQELLNRLDKAQRHLPTHSEAALRADDLRRFAKTLEES